MNTPSSDKTRTIRKSADRLKRSSAAELQCLVDLPDSEIDFDDIPKVSRQRFVAMAQARQERLATVGTANKQRVTMYLDRRIVDAFKSEGPGYQTRINEALRVYLSSRQAKRSSNKP